MLNNKDRADLSYGMGKLLGASKPKPPTRVSTMMAILSLVNPFKWLGWIFRTFGLVFRLNGFVCGIIVMAVAVMFMFEHSEHMEYLWWVFGIGAVNSLSSVFK